MSVTFVFDSYILPFWEWKHVEICIGFFLFPGCTLAPKCRHLWWNCLKSEVAFKSLLVSTLRNNITFAHIFHLFKLLITSRKLCSEFKSSLTRHNASLIAIFTAFWKDLMPMIDFTFWQTVFNEDSLYRGKTIYCELAKLQTTLNSSSKKKSCVAIGISRTPIYQWF